MSAVWVGGLGLLLLGLGYLVYGKFGLGVIDHGRQSWNR